MQVAMQQNDEGDASMRHFLIDTDTASDDAVALVMALRHPDVQVEAITVVAGNVTANQGVQNALYTVELCQKRVSVYRGMRYPLLRPLETAEDIHGSDGMGDIGLPLYDRKPASGHAVDVIREVINRYPGEITIVALAPLTNIAMALLLEPDLASMVKECIIMGGTAQGIGNVNPVAEFNIWVDPEAAKIVFSSDMPITMVDWFISTEYATISNEEAEKIRSIGTPLAQFCVDIQRAHRDEKGFVIADPIAMAIALDRSVATEIKRLYVDVETTSAISRGQTVIDHLNFLKQPPNADVVLVASHERFLEILHAALQ
jgi:purine nucleosidase